MPVGQQLMRLRRKSTYPEGSFMISCGKTLARMTSASSADDIVEDEQLHISGRSSESKGAYNPDDMPNLSNRTFFAIPVTGADGDTVSPTSIRATSTLGAVS